MRSSCSRAVPGPAASIPPRRSWARPPLDLAPLAVAGANSTGMFLSVWCREESPFSTRKTIRRSGKGSRFARALTASQLAFLEYCRAWRVARADPVQNTAVRSDISTFILVGQYDPVTPREYADRAASTLSRSQVVEFPSTGYAVLIFPTLCWLELVQGFLARPGAPLGTACLARDYPPLAFDAAVPARASGGSKAP